MTKVDSVIKGLKLLRNYDADDCGIAVERDLIYAGGDCSQVERMAEEDVAKLVTCGWFWDDTVDSWTIHI